MNEIGMALLWGIYLLIGVASVITAIALAIVPTPPTDFVSTLRRDISSAGPRLVWAMVSVCLWLWGIWVDRLRSLAADKTCRPHPLHRSILAFFTLSALPYRAYPLTCCLLD